MKTKVGIFIDQFRVVIFGIIAFIFGLVANIYYSKAVDTILMITIFFGFVIFWQTHAIRVRLEELENERINRSDVPYPPRGTENQT